MKRIKDTDHFQEECRRLDGGIWHSLIACVCHYLETEGINQCFRQPDTEIASDLVVFLRKTCNCNNASVPPPPPPNHWET